jgi:hypothetical protein
MTRTSIVRGGAIGLLVIAGLMWSRPAVGQSLGEVARREAERRKAIKGPVTVYTNDSLQPSSSDAAPPPGSAATPDVPAKADGAKPATAADAAAPAVDQKKDPEYWRKRIADVRTQHDRNAFLMDAIQTRINSLTADFTARDDPAQRQVLFDTRQRALAELDRMTQEQAALDKQLGDIQEEARRANVPAGWVR